MDAIDPVGGSSTDKHPIFIGGCSRSGTTLLAAMLGTSPQLVTVPEAEFKWDILEDGTAFDGTIDVGLALSRLRTDPKFALWRVELPTRRTDEAMRRMSHAAFLTDLVCRYAEDVHKPQARWWVDHTPANIRYVRTLAQLFPAAKFVHIIRDGRAVAASVRPLDFGPNTVAEAADYWSSQVGIGLAAAAFLPAGRLITVRFEDLVTAPRMTLQTVCAEIGIPFRPGMIDQRDYQVQAYTARQHRLVASSPDPSRADAWRRTLTPREVEIFEARTGELLGYLGYQLDFGITARDLSKREHLTQAVVSLWRRLLTNRTRRVLRRRLAGVSPAPSSNALAKGASA